MHAIGLQQNEDASTIESTVSNKVSENSAIKHLLDVVLEDESDTNSLYSNTSVYVDDDSQVLTLLLFAECACVD